MQSSKVIEVTIETLSKDALSDRSNIPVISQYRLPKLSAEQIEDRNLSSGNAI